MKDQIVDENKEGEDPLIGIIIAIFVFLVFGLFLLPGWLGLILF